MIDPARLASLAETARILGTTLTVLPPDGSDAAPVVIDGRPETRTERERT